MTAIAYTFPSSCAPGAPLVLVPQAPSQAAVFRRRRVVALVLAVSVAFALGLGLNAAINQMLQTSSQPALIATVSEPGPTQWVVQPGDTLWSIVSAAHPGADPRPMVAELQKQGASAQLQIGDVVTVP